MSAEVILHGLNAQQRLAVVSQSPVLQVLAPPGSGKTKTLTARVAYLIEEHGIRPWDIIVCTFTIKAAREMQERIKNFVGEKVEKQLKLGTFHSVARRYLSQYGEHIGIEKNFGIADTSDSKAIIKRIIKERSYDFNPSQAKSRISSRKSKTTTDATTTSNQRRPNVEEQEFDRLFDEYNERLRSSNLLDYDDLLLKCVELLRDHPECVANIQAVLIDEFQDTNNVQYDLMTLLAYRLLSSTQTGRKPSITIVGDPDQSIYSFRAAEIKNLTKMQTQYVDTQVIHLEENYRSSGAILFAATEVIEQDTIRPKKKLLPTHGFGERPVLRKLDRPVDEAEWLVGEVERLVQLTAGVLLHDDFAILLRSAALSRPIEAQLGKCGIPYRMVGGSRFFDRAEIKIILDYLRVISQPSHSEAISRVINEPPRGIGAETVTKILKQAEDGGRPMWEIVLDLAQDRRRSDLKLGANQLKGLSSFVGIIMSLQKKLGTGCGIAAIISALLDKLEFKAYLKKKYGKSEDYEGRWANVEELLQYAQDLAPEATFFEADEEQDGDVDADTAEGDTKSDFSEALCLFLSNISLSTEVEKPKHGEEAQKVVTLSTIHAAKGLEWPVVFIPAAYTGSIPHSRADDTDEERRLLYVGMTRAQALLYISTPKNSAAREALDLSEFLDGGSIQQYFEGKAPTIKHSTVKDLATILRRVCPNETVTTAARKSAERTEDNVFDEHGYRRQELDHSEYWDNRKRTAQLMAGNGQPGSFHGPGKRVCSDPSDRGRGFSKATFQPPRPTAPSNATNKPFKLQRPGSGPPAVIDTYGASAVPGYSARTTQIRNLSVMQAARESNINTSYVPGQAFGDSFISAGRTLGRSLNEASAYSINSSYIQPVSRSYGNLAPNHYHDEALEEEPDEQYSGPSFQSARQVYDVELDLMTTETVTTSRRPTNKRSDSEKENAQIAPAKSFDSSKPPLRIRPGKGTGRPADQASIRNFFTKGGG